MGEPENLKQIDDAGAPKIRRLNKLPVYLFIGLVVVFGVVIIYGLATRGLSRGPSSADDEGGQPASNFADKLKAGVSNGVIDEPKQAIAVQPVEKKRPEQKQFTNPFQSNPVQQQQQAFQPPQESDLNWRERMNRQFEEQEMQEAHRQKMKRMQSVDAALDSPIAVSLKDQAVQGQVTSNGRSNGVNSAAVGSNPSASDLYSAAMQAAKGNSDTDPNGQSAKENFLTKEITDAGYLDKQVVPQQSPYELKRGSVIPATLITGINSDLPGRITAQVRQNISDSATGHRLLIPQGTKLLGRYDSKVSFGQSRVLVVWTDIIFPNGSTLQIGSMAGVDNEGYGGFKDKVNNHYLKTFGSAALLALIGTGIDMSIPNDSTLSNQTTAADSARQNFAEVFGRVAEKTIEKNLNVQPTIEIRPGYTFNILVDQDIIFPGMYQG
jgi:type IV secretion system protein TrbI